MLERARNFAIKMHKQQMYGDKPYLYHLEKVVKNLKNYGELACVIGYLHDVVEDTETTIKDIEKEFGLLVASCVSILTDEAGKTRKERKQKTYAKMAKINQHSDEHLALIVKTADRLANVEESIHQNNKRLINIYLEEHNTFRQSVYRENLCDDLWEKLENMIQKT